MNYTKILSGRRIAIPSTWLLQWRVNEGDYVEIIQDVKGRLLITPVEFKPKIKNGDD